MGSKTTPMLPRSKKRESEKIILGKITEDVGSPCMVSGNIITAIRASSMVLLMSLQMGRPQAPVMHCWTLVQ